jgi:hypothetical protein
MDRSHVIDGQRVRGSRLIGSAEPFMLDRNLNVLKHTDHFSFFIPAGRLRNERRSDTGASQAVRNHVRYRRRLRA